MNSRRQLVGRLAAVALIVVLVLVAGVGTLSAVRGASGAGTAQADQQQATLYRQAEQAVVQEWAIGRVYWVEPDSGLVTSFGKLDKQLSATFALLRSGAAPTERAPLASLAAQERRYQAVFHAFFRAIESGNESAAGTDQVRGVEPLERSLASGLDRAATAEVAQASSALAASRSQQAALRALLLALTGLGLLLALVLFWALRAGRASTVNQPAGEELDRRVQERTAQLEAVNKELETFAYSVSHDLRAPLNKIAGFTQALLEDYGDQLDGEGREYLTMAVEACRNMSQRMDGLLRLSRLNRAEMRWDTVDLSGLAKTVASEIRHAEPDREADFVIEDGLQVEGDTALLQVALENLVGNAWKFTRYKPSARIEVGSVGQDGSRAFFVRDNGAGFDMAYAEKLFGPFQRLHAAREFEGTGIGLATVQRVIHRHGGQVWAEGAEGEGSTFYFTLDGHGEVPDPT